MVFVSEFVIFSGRAWINRQLEHFDSFEDLEQELRETADKHPLAQRIAYNRKLIPAVTSLFKSFFTHSSDGGELSVPGEELLKVRVKCKGRAHPTSQTSEWRRLLDDRQG